MILSKVQRKSHKQEWKRGKRSAIEWQGYLHLPQLCFRPPCVSDKEFSLVNSIYSVSRLEKLRIHDKGIILSLTGLMHRHADTTHLQARTSDEKPGQFKSVLHSNAKRAKTALKNVKNSLKPKPSNPSSRRWKNKKAAGGTEFDFFFLANSELLVD